LIEGEEAFAPAAVDGSSTAARAGQLLIAQLPDQYTQFAALAGVV
jgi:hypothetical protein